MSATSESRAIMQFDDCEVVSPVYEVRVPGTANRLVSGDPERNAAARDHAEHLQHVFERAEVELDREDAATWVADYGRLIDKVRAALDWSFSSHGDAAIGVGLTIATIPLWILCAHPAELRRRIERALVSKAAATRSAREMQLRAAATLARMVYETLPAEDLQTSATTQLARGMVLQRHQPGGTRAA
jgi:hypothetical protein